MRTYIHFLFLLGVWAISCATTGAASDPQAPARYWTLARNESDSCIFFTIRFYGQDATVVGPTSAKIHRIEWSPNGANYVVDTKPAGAFMRTFAFAEHDDGFDLLDRAGKVALGVRIVAGVSGSCTSLMYFATATPDKDGPLAMLEGGSWILSLRELDQDEQ